MTFLIQTLQRDRTSCIHNVTTKPLLVQRIITHVYINTSTSLLSSYDVSLIYIVWIYTYVLLYSSFFQTWNYKRKFVLSFHFCKRIKPCVAFKSHSSSLIIWFITTTCVWQILPRSNDARFYLKVRNIYIVIFSPCLINHIIFRLLLL